MAAVNDIQDEAAAQTGLTDFGDDSYRDGLDILLASLRDEARLNDSRRGVHLSRISAIWRSACRSRTGTGDTPRSTTCPSTRR